MEQQELKEMIRNAVKEVIGELQDTDRLMTTQEAADYFRMSRWTFARHSKLIPHKKLDGKVLFRKSDLDSYLEHVDDPSADPTMDPRLKKLIEEMDR